MNRSLLPLLLLALVAPACNDDPGTIGSDYLPELTEFRTYVLSPDEIALTSGVSVLANSSAEATGVMLVGATGTGERAHGLFAYVTVPAILKDTAKQLTGATLTLHGTDYAFGDTVSPRASFELVSIEGTFAGNGKWSDTLVAKITAGEVLGSVDAAFTRNGRIDITLDTAAVDRFLKSYYSDNGGSIRVLRSLALRARDGSSVVGIHALAGVDTLLPALKLTFTGDTTITLLPGATSWIGLADTTGGAGAFVLRGGVAQRTHVSFNLDSIPIDATIHQAEFRFTLKDARKGTYPDPLRIVADVARDTSLSPLFYLGTANVNDYALAIPIPGAATPTYRIANFGSVVARWQLARRGFAGGGTTTPNRGLVMHLNRNLIDNNLAHFHRHENETLDRYEFHGTDAADTSLRPRLTVIYSVQNDVQ